MANLGFSFDANNVEPSAPRELLPPGKYVAQIVASDMVPTKTGGQMLKLEFDVLDGAHAGRKVWVNLNLVHQNAQAVEIAQRELSAICRATGQMTVSDSEHLHFKAVEITVKVEEGRPKPTGGTYDPQNRITGYAPVNRGGARPAVVPTAPRPVAPPAAPAAVATAAAPASPPWKQRAA